MRFLIKKTNSAGANSLSRSRPGATKMEKRKALPIVKARLGVADFDRMIEVMDDMNEAVFRVTLKKGNCDIQSQFIGNDGKEYGAYFRYFEGKA